jgi:hypothetical protein
MSQSDYIKFKRISNLLKYNKYEPVFTNQEYIDLTQYQIANSIPDTKLVVNAPLPEGKTLIFDVIKDVADCPEFISCVETNLRPNRIEVSDASLGHRFTPRPQLKYVKQPPHIKSICDCKVVSTKEHLRTYFCVNC